MDKLFVSFLSAISAALFLHAEHMERICLYPRLEILRRVVHMIPGSGRDVPVQPGGKLLIVDNALNHTVANPNSWDMTTADYEWYDESTNPQFTDIDNPKVPNLEKIYCSTLTAWQSPHRE